MHNKPLKHITALSNFNTIVSLIVVLGLVSGCATDSSRKIVTDVPSCCSKHASVAGDVTSNETNKYGAPIGSNVSEVGYKWQNDLGQTVALDSLKGRIQVVSMFFATCQGICVITREDMEKVEASLPSKLKDRVGFVLITLDPYRDSAAALKAYRTTENLPVSRWNLLRGDRVSTRKMANFLGVAYGADASGRFVHSSEIVVLDEQGRLIARYAGVRKNLQSIVTEIEVAADKNFVAAN